ncbi:MAG: hypothetical protein AB199_04435, partial [Parcubacteria bacterium C7867-004]
GNLEQQSTYTLACGGLILKAIVNIIPKIIEF